MKNAITQKQAIAALKLAIENDRAAIDAILLKAGITYEPGISNDNLFRLIGQRIIDGNNYLLMELMKMLIQKGYFAQTETQRSADGDTDYAAIATAGASVIGALAGLFGKKPDNSQPTQPTGGTNTAEFQQYLAQLKAQQEAAAKAAEEKKKSNTMLAVVMVGGLLVLGAIVTIVLIKRK